MVPILLQLHLHYVYIQIPQELIQIFERQEHGRGIVQGMDPKALASAQVFVNEKLYRMFCIVHKAERGHAPLLKPKISLQPLFRRKAYIAGSQLSSQRL